MKTVQIERYACGCEFFAELVPEQVAEQITLAKCPEWLDLDKQFWTRKITGDQFSRLSAQHAKKTRSELVRVEAPHVSSEPYIDPYLICETCGDFPCECADWTEDDEYHGADCRCETCLQDHPERNDA